MIRPLREWAKTAFYRVGWLGVRFTLLCTMNARTIRRHRGNQPGAFVLACTHLSHVEPMLISGILRRKVDWMARSEFYRNPLLSATLYGLDAFKVYRQGVPVSAIRTAIDRLKRGRIVGIFPEGGVSRGQASACLGGPIKLGAALVACRAGVPVIPCVVVGTDRLNCVRPWLPFKRAYTWIAFGEPIAPHRLGETPADRRAAYAGLGRDIQSGFMALYQEIRAEFGLGDMAGETYSEPDTASHVGSQRAKPVAPPVDRQSDHAA